MESLWLGLLLLLYSLPLSLWRYVKCRHWLEVNAVYAGVSRTALLGDLKRMKVRYSLDGIEYTSELPGWIKTYWVIYDNEKVKIIVDPANRLDIRRGGRAWFIGQAMALCLFSLLLLGYGIFRVRS